MVMKLTIAQATDLIARTKTAAQDGNLLGVIQPNGKRLADCTSEEIAEIGEALSAVGVTLGDS
jgi:hypothetical protein